MYWLYWESPNNNAIPQNVKTLVNIFKQKLKNVTILTNKTIHKYISIVNTTHLKHLAQKVDYYRAKILYTYGGIWLDMDTIVLDNIDYLYVNLLKSTKEVCISVSELSNNNVCLAYLIAKPKSIIFEKWYMEMETLINKKGQLEYGYFGTLLSQIINKNNLINTILPFPNEIAFRFGCKNIQKYYLTDEKFINENIMKIKENKYKIIILYGSGGFYKRPINEDTMLFKFIEYAKMKSKPIII
tara:strand:+ start:2667 stop:3392 length:726 start_codon:yes stop_codon:yes gene_type:complete